MADLSTELIKNLSTYGLYDRLSHPHSSKEEKLIREELERRKFPASVWDTPISDWAKEFNRGLEPQIRLDYDALKCFLPSTSNPATRFLFGVDLAENDSPSDLKINVKRHKIKLNFKN